MTCPSWPASLIRARVTSEGASGKATTSGPTACLHKPPRPDRLPPASPVRFSSYLRHATTITPQFTDYRNPFPPTHPKFDIARAGWLIQIHRVRAERTESGSDSLCVVLDTDRPRNRLIHTLLAPATTLLMEYSPTSDVPAYLHEVANLIG
jgi:hypothetical protein